MKFSSQFIGRSFPFSLGRQNHIITRNDSQQADFRRLIDLKTVLDVLIVLKLFSKNNGARVFYFDKSEMCMGSVALSCHFSSLYEFRQKSQNERDSP